MRDVSTPWSLSHSIFLCFFIGHKLFYLRKAINVNINFFLQKHFLHQVTMLIFPLLPELQITKDYSDILFHSFWFLDMIFISQTPHIYWNPIYLVDLELDIQCSVWQIKTAETE